MYLGIDIGGTKTLIASFKHDGTQLDSVRFRTPKHYKDFLEILAGSIPKIARGEWTTTCIAAPGRVDRDSGRIIRLGNLPWKDVPIVHDVTAITGGEVLLENDAKLATLSESRLLKPRRHKTIFLTISTGIGGGLAIDGQLDPNFLDMEPGRILAEHNGKLVKWESLASGKAIVRRFGRRASEINDQHVWKLISHDLAIGLLDIIAEFQPDIVLIGGGVGSHFNKFGALLKNELKKYEDDLVPIPPIVQAKRPEEAVIYGCYEFISDHVKAKAKPRARAAR